MVQSVPDPKNMAKALRGELRSRFKVDASHSDCLEVVARQHGVDNWNILVAQQQEGTEPAGGEAKAAFPWGARTATIPVLRIFAVDPALQFYVDFLGFTLDFGGPNGGPGTAYYGQVSCGATTLHLAEAPNAEALVRAIVQLARGRSGCGRWRRALRTSGHAGCRPGWL